MYSRIYVSAVEESFCVRWLSSDAKYSKVKKGGSQTSADDTICGSPTNPPFTHATPTHFIQWQPFNAVGQVHYYVFLAATIYMYIGIHNDNIMYEFSIFPNRLGAYCTSIDYIILNIYIYYVIRIHFLLLLLFEIRLLLNNGASACIMVYILFLNAPRTAGFVVFILFLHFIYISNNDKQ